MKLMIRVKGRALQAQRPGKVRKREKEDDHIFLFSLFLFFFSDRGWGKSRLIYVLVSHAQIKIFPTQGLAYAALNPPGAHRETRSYQEALMIALH
jgi:hypothetical protein